MVRIRAQARDEIEEAFDWYRERSLTAASELLHELDVAMQRIAEAPEQFPVVRGRLRRVLLHRFPYAVYNKVYPTTISVVGVIHGRRHPSTWQRRAGP
ncbi:type II toxin-antitoxin system RelE/ParE family toxin [Gemmatimonas sp.]